MRNMKRLLVLSVFIFCMFFAVGSAYADTNVSGTISADTTWTAVNSPYILTGDVTVAQGVTLTVEPGVVVKANYYNYGLTVQGEVYAAGTGESQIVFTSKYDADYGGGGVGTSYTYYWKGITIESTGEFNGYNIKVRYSGCTTSCAGFWVNGKLNLVSSEIYKPYYRGIYVSSNNAVTVRNNTMTYCTWTNLEFINNGTNEFVIENNTLNRSAIRANNYSSGTVTVQNNTITDANKFAIEVKNTGTGIITARNNTITSTYGLYIGHTGSGTTNIEDNIVQNGAGYGLYIYSYNTTGVLSIRNNSISNMGYPLYINLDYLYGPISSIIAEVSNNTFNNCGSTVNLGGTLKTNMTLPKSNYSYYNSYLLVSEVGVDQGVTLTVEPGVVLKAGRCGILTNGVINAIGTAESPIIFTSVYDSEYGGSGVTTSTYHWYGITVSSTGEFNGDNIKVRYSGGTTSCAGFWVNGKLNLVSSEIYKPYYRGIYVSSNNAVTVRNNTMTYCTWTNLEFINNGTNEFVIENNTLNRSAIRANNYSSGTVTVQNNTITDANKFAIEVKNTGTGIITARNNTITSTYGLYIGHTGSGTTNIEDNIVQNGAGYGLYIYSYNTTGVLSIRNNSISNMGYPLYINLDYLYGPISSIIAEVSNNTFNNCGSTINLGGTLKTSMVLPKSKYNYYKSYLIIGGMIVAQGVTLNIDSGVVIRVSTGGSNRNITVNGIVNAIGAPESPIVFTSEYDSEYGGSGVTQKYNYWNGIEVSSTGEFNGDNIKVRYGGYSGSTWLANIRVFGKLNLVNSEVYKAYYYSIYINSGIQPTIINNSFVMNSGYGFYNAKYSTMTIDASMNYWGAYSGPKAPDNPSGTGDKVNAGVTYSPWLVSNVWFDPGLRTQTFFGEQDTNIATGNFSRSHTDLTVTSPGFELSFSRTYNSKDDKTGSSMGRGWTFGFEGSIITDPYNSATKIIRLPDGSIQTFTDTGSGAYIANDSRNTLVKQADATHILTTKDQYQYGFDTNGRLVWMKDRNGNTVTIQVDASTGKVNSITDGAGRQYTITYNPEGFIETITDPANRQVRYEYENSLLVRAIDPMGSITRYTYDAQGYLTEIRDHNSNLIEAITTYAEGDSEGKVSQTTDAYGNTHTYTYDTANRKTTITDTNSRETIHWYDRYMYTIKTQDAEGRQTTVEYFTDASGVNKYGEEKSVTDRNVNKTDYQRDDRGNITKITNPDTSFREMAYDDKNNLISERDEDGKYTFYIYDAEKKNLIKKAQPLNGTDQYTQGCDETPFAVTNYTYYTPEESQQLGYNAKGLIKTITDPKSHSAIYTYDTYGNVETVTESVYQGRNITTTYQYNNIGWKTRAISPMGFETTYTYDQNGRLEKTVLHGGETTRTTYDAMGRKTKEISPNLYDPDADDIQNHTYSGNHGYRYTYYPSGLLHTSTDPEGNTSTYTYDLYGNIKTETKPNGAVYEYEYDVMNRLAKVSFKENAESNPVLLEEYAYTILIDGKTQKAHTRYLNSTETAVTIYTYDYAGRLVEQQNSDGTTLATSYNPNGTINITTDQNNSATYYKYDGLNRLTEQWSPFENTGGTIKYTYTGTAYDKAGRKIAETAGKDKVELYNTPARTITTNYSYYENGWLETATDSAGRKTEYSYDDDGNITKEEMYTDEINRNTTEYTNNHLGKPIEKKVHTKEGDLFGNNFENTQDTILTTAYTYDKNGNLKTKTTPDNTTTTYEYDTMDRKILESMPGQDEYGASVTIAVYTTYNWEGKPLIIVDALDNTTTHAYDKRGQLKIITDADGGVTAYYYDRAGRKIAEVSPKNYDLAKELTEMNRTEYTYDLMDRVKTITQTYYDTDTSQWITITSKAYKYDNRGNKTKELDALGYDAGTGETAEEKINTGYGTEYVYNLANKLTETLDPESKDRSLSFTIKYEYDALGRKTAETNAKGVITTYYYDDAGNITSTTVRETIGSPEQTLQENTYDLIGNLKTTTDGNGNTTVYEYNAYNKLRKAVYPGDETIPANAVTYQYDTVGNLKKQQDTEGTVDLYNYDSQGRQLSRTQQKEDGTENITNTTSYDKNGNKRFETDGNNNTTEYTYDSLNRLKTVTNAVYQTTIYRYDANSNLLTTTDWRGNIYSNVYDPLNRLLEKKDPYGKIIQKNEYYKNGLQSKSYDALNNLTQYLYDKNNKLVQTIDPENHTTSQAYDDTGNIYTRTDGRGKTTTYNYDLLNRLESVVNAKNETTSYTYDLNGNMLTQTDAKGHTTTFEYNAANKPVKRIDHGGIGNPAKTESYTYYANGNLKTKTDRNGETTTYTYDSHGRMTSQAVGGQSISYTYDLNGNQLTMTDSTGTTVREYDGLNRAVTKTVPGIGISYYDYDIIDSVGEGEVAETTTDPKGNITTKVYDRAGRLKEVRTENGTTTYTYYDNGAKQSVVYPDGSREVYTYYPDNTLHTLTNRKPDSAVIDTYSYTYDAANNQTTKVDARGTTSYTYDDLNRLETVSEPNGKVTIYTFDMAGNRAAETVTQPVYDSVYSTYSYNEQNRLMEILTWANGIQTETVIFTYDNNGSQLTVSKAVYEEVYGWQSPTVTINEYDLFNQLIKTTTPDNKVITNTYDGEGKRTAKDVDGETTRYLYEYDKVILELDGEGGQKARNVHGTSLISRDVEGLTGYYFYNGHGDVTVIQDVYGNQLALYYYDAFGNPETVQESVYNPYRYAGYMYDEETGTYYLMARMYDPETARFLQEDTYRGNPNDPLSLNLYTYCHNEPIMYTDPDGHAEVALREYAEKLGGKVTWDNKSKTAIVQLNGATKQFKADNYKLVNGRMKLDDEIFNKTFGLNTKKSTSKVENKPTAASVAKNAGLGAGDAGVSAVTGIAHAVRHPIETGKGILTLAQYNPRVPNYTTIQINAAIADAATEAYDEFKEGDADVKARYIGRAVGEGILVAAGTKGVDKASKAARIGDIASDTAKITKVTFKNIDEGLNFATTPAKHMENPSRFVPMQTLQDAIKSTKSVPDPRGSNAMMHYTTMTKNGQTYNLEVLYNEATNTVYHFEYTKKAIGDLPAIPK